MKGPKRFLECLFPVTICNLSCHYCYVIQENRRKMKKAELKYSPKHIAKALSVKRLGGICLINICGLGETLIQKEVIDIIALLLKEGHFVSITTNGTLSVRFDELIENCEEYINHLHIAFSCHYIELKNKNLLDTYYSNIRKMKNAGASILYQLNLCDEYIPLIDEIKEISLKELGAFPQIALTRNEKTYPMKIHTKLSDENYYKEGEKFNSPLFRFTFENFNKKRKEFCYSGDWAGVLNLGTGIFQNCYCNNENQQNIFENIDKPIHFEAIGNNCKNSYCVNSSHFMSLGVIPSIKTPTYYELRNRPESNWYSQEMIEFLNGRLYDNNKEYNFIKKIYINIRNFRFKGIKSIVADLFPDLYINYKKKRNKNG